MNTSQVGTKKIQLKHEHFEHFVVNSPQDLAIFKTSETFYSDSDCIWSGKELHLCTFRTTKCLWLFANASTVGRRDRCSR